jgi:5-methyltetrahydrofolate--homocysteine methyltransferase
MGSELLRRGAPHGSCLEELNLSRPESVAAIHAEFRSAGADILTTNTFGGNSFRLAFHKNESRVREINVAAAKLARERAQGALVAGSIGPTGEYSPRPSFAALQAAFRDQAGALDEAGVDLFLCETFGDVEELRAAITAIRDVSAKPIVAQMTYIEGGRTPMDLTPAEVVTALADLPLAAIGANCAIGDATTENVIRALRAATQLPLIAQPNAGRPARSNGKFDYPIDPEMFAALATRLAEYAAIVGGCCGATPTHIAAVRHRLSEGM